MSRIEIEADVPDGWVGVEYRRLRPDESGWILKDGQAVWWDGAPCSSFHFLILRRVEPKKESRWRRVPPPERDNMCHIYKCRDDAISVSRERFIERIDYENDIPVSVALESVEQPLTPSAPPKE